MLRTIYEFKKLE